MRYKIASIASIAFIAATVPASAQNIEECMYVQGWKQVTVGMRAKSSEKPERERLCFPARLYDMELDLVCVVYESHISTCVRAGIAAGSNEEWTRAIQFWKRQIEQK